MGVVWAAERMETGERVAMKFLKARTDSGRVGEQRRRLLREARAAAAVRHPNVVQVEELLVLADGSPVLVMELLTGETLRQRLDREGGSISLRHTCKMLTAVTSAIEAAHATGVIHRDLKPDNIFLTTGPEGGTVVKVLDFGIAKLATGSGALLSSGDSTATGTMLGTPCYMSPEQTFGERDVDYRTDVWSLGIILYQCLSGVLPTRAENVGQVVKIISKGLIIPLEKVAPQLPQDVTKLVSQMLSISPEDRPNNLREVREVLEPYSGITSSELRHSATLARSGTAPDRVKDLKGGSVSVTVRTLRQRMWVAMGAAVASTIAAGLLAWRSGQQLGPTAEALSLPPRTNSAVPSSPQPDTVPAPPVPSSSSPTSISAPIPHQLPPRPLMPSRRPSHPREERAEPVASSNPGELRPDLENPYSPAAK